MVELRHYEESFKDAWGAVVLKNAENGACTNTAGLEAYTVASSSFCLGVSEKRYPVKIVQLGNSWGLCLGWNQVLSELIFPLKLP